MVRDVKRRRILLAVTGLSPQVLTEALYALAVVRQPAWLADEVHLITTRPGADNARLRLLGPNTRWLHRLCHDWHLPVPRLDDGTLHIIQDPCNGALDDIRDDNDNAAAADCIMAVVRELTRDDDTEVCGCIAGGRKTMGYLLGAAMGLYGRPQDTLCHVLVSSPYESHPEFFYPTPTSHIITALDRTAQALDCRDAKVWLGDIPFVRLRGWVLPETLGEPVRFTEAVAAASAALQRRAPVRLYVGPAGAWVNDDALALTARQLGLLQLLAAHTVADSGLRSPLRGVDDDAEWRQQALDIVRHVWGDAAVVPALRRWLAGPKAELAAGFDQQLSRLRRALRAATGQDIIEERAPGAVANRRSYRLALPAANLLPSPPPRAL